jgi:hypothetical protein
VLAAAGAKRGGQQLTQRPQLVLGQRLGGEHEQGAGGGVLGGGGRKARK